jgi:uncharacterized protein
MKLHLARAEGRNLFSGYGPGYVAINGVRILDWEAISFEQLNEAAFSGLAQLPLEILILGTGARLRFPRPALTRAIHAAGIGLEVMDTHAACRTYNILLSEDRRVGAALLIGPSA